MNPSHHILNTSIEYLKGVGPKRAEFLIKDFKIRTFGDLLQDIPFRYVDKTVFHNIKDIYEDGQTVQLLGTLIDLKSHGTGRKKRMTGKLKDKTGIIELVWFRGFQWIENLEIGAQYIMYGKVNTFNRKTTLPHPEIEKKDTNPTHKLTLSPVYSSTEKLTRVGLDSKGRAKLVKILFEKINPQMVPETLPEYMIKKLKLLSRYEALRQIHFPRSNQELNLAQFRLKFEELFLIQLTLVFNKLQRSKLVPGYPFTKVGDYLNSFYEKKLPFELTGAQKRVIKEIRKDLGSGKQMNRLLQGDVGSGKTMVALMSMLIALDNGYQTALLAPTEILATQHYKSISNFVSGLSVRVGFLSGNIKGAKRKEILKWLAAGEIHIMIGTHAILEDPVIFKSLGMAIIDEQHRFGVKQRSRLWAKSKPHMPHILVMTATPIPRTLAMTQYGDLDVSVIDELPPGRKEIKTMHKTEAARPQVHMFMKKQIDQGRQIYIVYPLIEESEKLDLQNLQDGYEQLLFTFPRPQYQIAIVHGRMKASDKEFEMKRFVDHKAQILVSTTVIEVGVDVPNATVMIIENTERFGLSQLHQLRGRVGRGGNQSYCLLMTGFKRSKEAKKRIDIMVKTNNGFEIAEADLEIRGAGDLKGTKQSGEMELKMSDLVTDHKIVKSARTIAMAILKKDPELASPHNKLLREYLDDNPNIVEWGRIS